MGRKESKQTNQHPVEYEKQLLYEENKKKNGDCHAIAHGFVV